MNTETEDDDLMNVPQHLIAITGLTDDDQRTQDPTTGAQFAVLDPDGERTAYGDQRYVAYGECLQDGHPDGKIQRRTITITYGEWVDHHG